MRKISNEAAIHFMRGQNYRNDNTEVIVIKNGNVWMYLHGNPIASIVGGILSVTTAGWNTITTKDRLNAIPDVKVHSKNHQLYLNDKEWDGSWKKIGRI